MRLFEAIMDANQRALAGDQSAGLRPAEFVDALPVVALTCIDPRLNPLMPEVLGIEEKDFIWLRNSGNIIFDPMSTMMRTLALACAVKGGREIAVVGHTDCHVRKTSMVELTDRFKALGIDRSRLPENLNEFFGLFASERQNVIRSADVVRSSPLIGPKVPVHGLLVDIETGKLEWIVNGYERVAASATTAAPPAPATAPGASLPLGEFRALPTFDLGEMKFPEGKIGEIVTDVGKIAASADAFVSALKQREPGEAWKAGKQFVSEARETARDTREAAQAAKDTLAKLKGKSPAQLAAALAKVIDQASRYHVIGRDQKQYGPIPGAKLLEWLTEGRLHEQSPVQPEGSAEWVPVSALGEKGETKQIPQPPPIPRPMKLREPWSKPKH